MTHRWARRSRRTLAGALTTALVLSVVTIEQGAALAAPAAPDFQSSFEAGEPQPAWTDTVETDASGKPKAGGVNGNDGVSIPGNVTDKVTEVRASGENAGSGEVKENLVDGNVNSKWLTFAGTGWLEFTLAEPVAITSYAVSSANDAPERDPKNWKLQGSNDNTAGKWTDIDVQNGQSFAKRFETKKYELTNTTAYKHLRFDITANNGGAATQFSEIQFAVKATSEPAPNMRSRIGKGPNGGYAAKSNAGYTGVKALQFLGQHVASGRGYSYNKVFDVDVAVKPDTELSYLIFPQFVPDDLKYPSTHAAVDLAFSDGSYLSELGAKDQYGFELSPKGQGASKSLYTNQWNKLKAKIGAVAAGKTIKRVLVAYDNPVGPGNFAGWFDDIRIGASARKQYSTPADYALTTRGTQSTGGFSRGNNFPATAVPHGFNFWTPMTNAGSISWLYDYHKANNAQNLPTLQAFTTSHEPSPWMGDRQTFQVFPQAGTPNIDRAARALPFKHENEIAKPHYYGVTFENGMRTEIAPTDHAALFRFTFTGNESNLLFDNVNNNGGLTLDTAKGVVTGYSDVKSGLSTGATRLFVYATFDSPVTGGGKLTGAGRDNVTGYLKFDTSTTKTVTMRIATSLIGVEQAKKNLEQEATGTFESVRDRAQQAWNEKLKVIEVEGASEDQLVTLYSNLYRLFLYPNSGHENVGSASAPVYKHASPVAPAVGQDTPAQTGAKIVDGKIYVNNGFWDTYRTTWPAYSLLTPEKAGEMVEGFVQQYKEGGWVSRWSSPGYANLMTGTSSDVSFSDAFLKGVTNFDVQAAYDAAVKNATVTPPNANVGRKGLDRSIFLGYTPTTTGEGMSWAIEGYVNDFGIATMSKALHDKAAPNDPRRKEYKENHEYFLNRAQNYVNMFDKSVGFFQGRTADGKWRVAPDKYEPREWGHDYTETNAWNMAFTVPHDGQGLANLYGGRAGLAKKLDQFFSTPETAGFPGSYGGVIHEMLEARDVRMGQYGHSNQPSHHIPYMYNYAGQPSKTQEKVREILSRLYLGSEIGQGYAGDEDNGELSAWYIFSALGFYPLQMGKPDYAIGSPLFTKATVHLGGGKTLVVSAPKNSAKNVYVQGLKVNGQKWDKTSLPHDVIARGGTLEFDMGTTPSTWGTGPDSAPESITKGSEVPRPLRDTAGTASTVALADNSSQTQATVDSVQLQASAAERVEFYTLTSGKDGVDAKSWKVKGSYDGKTWTTVDERDGQTFASRQQTRAFKLAKPGHYTWYRIEFGGSVTLSEVEFLSKPRAECTTTITGERSGPQTLSGVVCLKDATITGPVTIAAGASVYATGGRITGPVRANGAADVVLLGTQVTGPVDVTGSTGVVGVETARITGPLSLVNNSGAAAVAASTVDGPVTCSGNATDPSNNGLPVAGTGPRSGQCSGL